MNIKVKNLKYFEESFINFCDKRLELKKEKSLEKANSIIKELRENRNWSWYRELEYRNGDNLDSVAIFYRGVEITYREMFQNMKTYAKSLKEMGVQEGEAIPVCMSLTPEFVYLMGAVSMIGAQMAIFGSDFENAEEIIRGCSNRIMFVEDNEYEKLQDIIQKVGIKNLVMSSLSNSFKDGIDPYEIIDRPYAKLFENNTEEYKQKNDKIKSINEFSEIGVNYDGELIANTGLDDSFTITFSSGTTSKSPKPIIHATRSFNEVSRFHDPEINHTPSYKLFTIQATIPTYSSTGLISGISDALTQGTKLALEPIYDPDFAVDSLMINKPSYLDYTRSFWLSFAKNVLYNPKYKDIELPSLFICFSVGEPTDLAEEKLINRALKKVKAGRDILPLPLPIAKLSVAGGDCEHGGIFYRLFRSYSNMNPVHMIKGESAGLGTFDAVDIDILDENGNHCKPYQVGNLVATSELNMIGYKDNEEATNKFFIKNSAGKTYGDCCVEAYKDIFGYFHLKGRRDNSGYAHNISDTIKKSSKSVLSCEVVKEEEFYVAHVEFLPETKNRKLELIKIDDNCSNKLGEEINEKVLYRVHNNDSSFAVTHSGKRDMMALKEEGITNKCVKPVFRNGKYIFECAKEYIKSVNQKGVQKKK